MSFFTPRARRPYPAAPGRQVLRRSFWRAEATARNTNSMSSSDIKGLPASRCTARACRTWWVYDKNQTVPLLSQPNRPEAIRQQGENEVALSNSRSSFADRKPEGPHREGCSIGNAWGLPLERLSPLPTLVELSGRWPFLTHRSVPSATQLPHLFLGSLPTEFWHKTPTRTVISAAIKATT
jgi:hypothetical protein